ncbi:MAG: M42 family metallopeptidase [Anaerolineales bacterium]
MKSLLKSLVEIPAPPGHEKELRDYVREEIETMADEIRVDSMGNLIVRKGEVREGGKRIMIASHLDEIGLIATHIDKRGFIRFTNMGGVYPSYLLGGRVRFLDGTRGVINVEGTGKRKKVPGLDKMYIDIGAENENQCSIEIGDVAVFDRPWLDLGKRVVSKALDDRVGVAVMVETLREVHQSQKQISHESWFVFSNQEEVGLRGAGPAAYQLKPDIGLAIDVTRTGDTPQGTKMDVSLGEGPAIKIRDKGMLSHPDVVDWMIEVAQKHKISYQREVLERGTTDAASIQLTRGGVPSGCLSIPCRYVHSPSEMVDWDDVQQVAILLEKLLFEPFLGS